MATDAERAPLLNGSSQNDPESQNVVSGQENRGSVTSSALHHRTKAIIAGGLVFVSALAFLIVMVFVRDSLPKDPLSAAYYILNKAPVIDGHIDLPILVRSLYANNVSDVDLNGKMPGHVDIPRLRQGKVGGFFWSVFTPCEETGPDFVDPSNSVRDTLEQIDVAKQLIKQYHDTFSFTQNIQEVREAIRTKKIASLIGVEGAHQLGNSLGALRTYKTLGVKYVTLTHVCHNAFADSAGYGTYLPPRHGGLSRIGRSLINEMNRLGILVDLSHTSDATAREALQLSEAPVIWSHSSARAVWDHQRNVPDDILSMIGEGEGKKDAVVMVNFAPQFVAADGEATIQAVADHVDHIGNVAGRRNVGLGSDFDGINTVPEGLEDVSKYPHLIAELRKRGWTRRELVGLAGANVQRILENAEYVSRRIQLEEGRKPNYDLYGKRPDLPRRREL